MLRLIGLVLPLALDTFAVSAALGMAGVSSRRRFGLGFLFAAFEGGMPVIGLVVGAAVGTLVGGLADYIAIVALAGLGSTSCWLTKTRRRRESRGSPAPPAWL